MDKTKLTMCRAVEYLLKDLCVEWGFCIPTSDAERIKAKEFIEADSFACEVLSAEGMNPEYEVQWRKKIRNRFIEQFGQEISSSEFKQKP
ncbi:hypothetical protein L2750_03830 [Shewanella submarina]|uniref:Uncharacterized protein n=1 Tax=Shewanella submarina TaxID=2016376 RepID=A0ABV7GNA0_9GAMM|nr:hypothetical protein [Shewanella submarina]MCL1036279.1 hypothetical protein [Shewanella submarina]